MSVAIELDNLSLSYGDKAVLNKLSLLIEAGEFAAIVGPSGCGKSTLLSVIAGFLRPQSGHVLIDGQDVTQRPPRDRDVSLVFQDYALFPHLTVDENVAFGLKARRVPKKEVPDRVAEALEMTGLSGLGSKYPRHLSGGQRQRVALARSLVTLPRLLLLDEPLSNLDANLRRDMRLELKELQARVGTTTLLVTHDQEEALSMAHRVAILGQGTVEQFDTPEIVYQQPASQYVAQFMGETNAFPVEEHRPLRDGRVALASRGFTMAFGDTAADVVMVRPERIGVVADSGQQAEEGLRGTIQAVVYLGQAFQYVVQTESGTTVTARVGPQGGLQAGDPVVLSWDPLTAMAPGRAGAAVRLPGRAPAADAARPSLAAGIGVH